MKKSLSAVLAALALFLAATAPALAGDTKPPDPSGKVKLFMGVLEEKDGAIMLRCAAGLFVLTGNIPRNFVGKQCRLTGIVGKTSDGRPSIKVATCDEIKKHPSLARRKARRDAKKGAAGQAEPQKGGGAAPAKPSGAAAR